MTGEYRRRLGEPATTLAMVLVAILAALTATSCGASDDNASSGDKTASSGPRVLGAYIGKPSQEPSSSSDPTDAAPWDPAAIDAFAKMVGARPGVVMWYQDWGQRSKASFNPNSQSGKGIMDEVAARGAMPMVTWTPRDPSASPRQPQYSLATIISGQHDAYIKQWARDAKAWGKPFYLRFAHEMNARWQPWSPGVNGNTSAEYITAWRRVHDIFVSEGATNAIWVWAPYVSCGSGCSVPFEEVYPGDAYVDWVALDGYNWGTNKSKTYSSRGEWETMQQVFEPSYDRVTRLAPSKPFMITEVSTSDNGGDKPAWISDAFLKTIPERMPKTRAIIWFDSVKQEDWRIDTSNASLDAYRKVAGDPSYQGRLPRR